jgi:hypothetical protein
MAAKPAQVHSRKQRFKLRQAAKDRSEQVRLLVEKYLQRHQPSRCRLITQPGAVMEHDGRWYVVVEPEITETSAGNYTGRLMKTEEDLEKHEGLQVMLTPMLPQAEELEYEMPVLWALR